MHETDRHQYAVVGTESTNDRCIGFDFEAINQSRLRSLTLCGFASVRVIFSSFVINWSMITGMETRKTKQSSICVKQSLRKIEKKQNRFVNSYESLSSGKQKENDWLSVILFMDNGFMQTYDVGQFIFIYFLSKIKIMRTSESVSKCACACICICVVILWQQQLCGGKESTWMHYIAQCTYKRTCCIQKWTICVAVLPPDLHNAHRPVMVLVVHSHKIFINSPFCFSISRSLNSNLLCVHCLLHRTVKCIE